MICSKLTLVKLGILDYLTVDAALCAGFVKAAGGLMPVDCPGVENVNLSSLVDGHFDYAQKIDEILQIIDIHAV